MGLMCRIFGHKAKWVEEKRFLEKDEEPSKVVKEDGEMAGGDDRKVQIKTPKCERCGEDLTEDLMKKRLRQCGYCGGFDEPENMSTHGFFGRVCGHCASPKFWETWTESGEIVGMDVCPRCGSRTEFETLGSGRGPGNIGTVEYFSYRCPKCRLENLGYA